MSHFSAILIVSLSIVSAPNAHALAVPAPLLVSDPWVHAAPDPGQPPSTEEERREQEARARAREEARELQRQAAAQEQQLRDAARQIRNDARALQEQTRAQEQQAQKMRDEARKAREEARIERQKARDQVKSQKRIIRKDRGDRHASVQERKELRTFKGGSDSVLSVSNLAGHISVTAAAGNEVRVEAIRRGFGETDEEAARELEATEVAMEQRGGRLEIRGGPGSAHGHSEVQFTISAPSSVQVEIHSVAGDIALKGLKGDTRAESVSGDIVARESAALAALKTMSGDIDLSDCGARMELVVNSVSGDVSAARVKATSCTFGSISGEVGLNGVTCERAQVRTISGDLTFAGPLERAGRYEFKTHSGSIELFVDGGLAQV